VDGVCINGYTRVESCDEGRAYTNVELCGYIVTQVIIGEVRSAMQMDWDVILRMGTLPRLTRADCFEHRSAIFQT
jgi:hypothetical protein